MYHIVCPIANDKRGKREKFFRSRKICALATAHPTHAAAGMNPGELKRFRASLIMDAASGLISSRGTVQTAFKHSARIIDTHAIDIANTHAVDVTRGVFTVMADEFEELVGLEEEELEEEEFEEESAPEADIQEGGSGGDDTVPFVHLHVHSHYSLLDGAGKIDALVNRAKSLGMTALALTDHGNMYGILEFYQRCRDAGIKPILGFEAYIAPKSRTDRSTPPSRSFFHLTLLAMNKEGFNNLLYLTSQAFIDGFYYKPRIDKELLRDRKSVV